jgi:hypothetical protein
MKDFVILRGKIRDLGGAEAYGWWVMDKKGQPQTVVTQIFDDDSGNMLIKAMLDAGATIGG